MAIPTKTHWTVAGVTIMISVALLCVFRVFCPPLKELMPMLGLDWAEAMGGVVGLVGLLCWLIDLSTLP
jgi:hypothetical protein